MVRITFPFANVLAAAVAATVLFTVACRAAENTAADYTTLVAKGDAFDSKLQTKEALAVYLEADKLHPNDADLQRKLAKEYAESMCDTDSVPEKIKLGNEALDCATRTVELAPDNALSHLCLAVCYGRIAPLLDNKTKISYSKLVKEHADKALALDPKNSLTYHVLGAWNCELANLNPFLRTVAKWIYGELPTASNEDAVRNLKKALELDPNRLASHIQLGITYAAMGKKDEARAELRKGLNMPNREKDDPEMKRRARVALAKL